MGISLAHARLPRIIRRMTPVTAYIALGSNLGDRRAMIERAISMLDDSDDTEVQRISTVIETEPIGMPGQSRYLNAVARIETSLDTRTLLNRCLAIESELGRDRSRTERWGPRTIDLDLLLFGECCIDEPGLNVPHPHLHERGFVLQPLAEIAPNAVHPVYGTTIESLWSGLSRQSGRNTGQQSRVS